ncbi:DNA topoisomerase I, mitochondrial-like [Schistocerca gregaria]|uniref:DNA topoisomerase I, mitochondrial-like n=1 Tax=Schistocerca gregaria TaxID=7010 RepID=UPI00211EA009|nr:DNA topoisomerase I, mitochondrial-like [Schistocerca gregaria]
MTTCHHIKTPKSAEACSFSIENTNILENPRSYKSLVQRSNGVPDTISDNRVLQKMPNESVIQSETEKKFDLVNGGGKEKEDDVCPDKSFQRGKNSNCYSEMTGEKQYIKSKSPIHFTLDSPEHISLCSPSKKHKLEKAEPKKNEAEMNLIETTQAIPEYSEKRNIDDNKDELKNLSPSISNSAICVKPESGELKSVEVNGNVLDAEKVECGSYKKEQSNEIDNAELRYEWWKNVQIQKNPTYKWTTLQHNGVYFPPPYKPHGIPLIYDKKPVVLPPDAEEFATYFSKHIKGPYYERPRFRKNFFKDFLKILNSEKKFEHMIKKFELCDFSLIVEHLEKQAASRKSRSDEEKKLEKQEKLNIKAKYGYAIVDGHKEPLGNYIVEVPSLFLGRGNHPHTGRIKRRIMPENITLNLSEDAPIPECPIPNHHWGNIVHNHEVAWIATWVESVLGSNKYVMFGAASSIRGLSDRNKFEIARRLQNHIEKIRGTYEEELHSEKQLIRQRATALWLIDNLALRVGNEKKEDEADTVGCCSLRVEHVKLVPPSNLEFDFLGKDSMPYHKNIEVPSIIYSNMESFINSKKPKENIFDLLSTGSLNKHLNSQMPGLTAKVFRTYNASITLQNQLDKFTEVFNESPESHKRTDSELLLFYNRANRQVAILCNHQRTVPKQLNRQVELIDQRIESLKAKKKEIKASLKALVSEEGEAEAAKPQRKKRRTDKESKSNSSRSTELEKKLHRINTRIQILTINKMDRGEGSQIQNSTSKINYMDPRITVAWCSKCNFDLKKVFSKTLIEKFQWAISEIKENPDFCW